MFPSNKSEAKRNFITFFSKCEELTRTPKSNDSQTNFLQLNQSVAENDMVYRNKKVRIKVS